VSERLCSVSGEWHNAWDVLTNGILNFIMVDLSASFLSLYPVTGILLPFAFGFWRFNLCHFLVGPQLSILLTRNHNEVAAIWCLLSIGILLLVVETPIRQFISVKSCWLWLIQTVWK